MQTVRLVGMDNGTGNVLQSSTIGADYFYFNKRPLFKTTTFEPHTTAKCRECIKFYLVRHWINFTTYRSRFKSYSVGSWTKTELLHKIGSQSNPVANFLETRVLMSSFIKVLKLNSCQSFSIWFSVQNVSVVIYIENPGINKAKVVLGQCIKPSQPKLWVHCQLLP